MSKPFKKPLVFISHASEDKDMATEMRNWLIEAYRLDEECVFVSSSPTCISGNSFFTSRIGEALKLENVMIVLLSPDAIQNRWITFEVGSGFGRNSLISPILCRGAKVSDLKDRNPLGFLQAKHADNKDELEAVLQEIDKKLSRSHTTRDVDGMRKILCKPRGARVPQKRNNAILQPDIPSSTKPVEPAQVDDDIRKAERALEKMEQEKARKEELEIMRRKCAVLGIKI